MFRKPDLFPFSGEVRGGEIPTLLGSLERVNLNHWTMNDGQSPETQ
jgi:hypothetical protein